MRKTTYNENPVHIHDSEKFLKEVQTLVTEKKMSYMDSVLHLCEKQGMEPEMAAELIRSNAAMVRYIRNEATDLNKIKRTARLPF